MNSSPKELGQIETIQKAEKAIRTGLELGETICQLEITKRSEWC